MKDNKYSVRDSRIRRAGYHIADSLVDCIKLLYNKETAMVFLKAVTDRIEERRPEFDDE